MYADATYTAHTYTLIHTHTNKHKHTHTNTLLTSTGRQGASPRGVCGRACLAARVRRRRARKAPRTLNRTDTANVGIRATRSDVVRSRVRPRECRASWEREGGRRLIRHYLS